MGSLAVGGSGQSGPPGPPGPQGPMGLPGPPGGLLPGTAFEVQARADMLPIVPWLVGQWITLTFDAAQVDTHQAITPGPEWSWRAPVMGTYLLLCSLQVNVASEAPWILRVLRNGVPQVDHAGAGPSGQILWVGSLLPGEALQVQIQAPSAPPGQVSIQPPRGGIVITGCSLVHL